MNWVPVVWKADSNAEWFRDITIETVRNRLTVEYAVRNRSTGSCMNRETGEMDYEPTPSERTDEWLATHRFPTLGNAINRIERT